MDLQHRNDEIEIPPDAVADITRLYEQGLYVQACTRAAALPPPAQWRGTMELRLIAGCAEAFDFMASPSLTERCSSRFR